jgi:CRISP-associated protein Cas1
VLADAVSYDAVLGHEGSATREYFRAWRHMIGENWGFTARERRPPPDPVNAMLSFGYTLLVQEAIAALETAGLDAAVGFLHRARWGRPCLALDLMEEFRRSSSTRSCCVACPQASSGSKSSRPPRTWGAG